MDLCKLACRFHLQAAYHHSSSVPVSMAVEAHLRQHRAQVADVVEVALGADLADALAVDALQHLPCGETSTAHASAGAHPKHDLQTMAWCRPLSAETNSMLLRPCGHVGGLWWATCHPAHPRACPASCAAPAPPVFRRTTSRISKHLRCRRRDCDGLICRCGVSWCRVFSAAPAAIRRRQAQISKDTCSQQSCDLLSMCEKANPSS